MSRNTFRFTDNERPEILTLMEEQSPRERLWRRVRIAACVLLGIQLLGFVWFSTYEYLHFDEQHDFGLYVQAWSLIAHGHLNPHGTLLGTSFWRNDSEFVMWPLALLYWVCPSAVVLVWLQSVTVVATEWVAFDWICRMVTASRLNGRGIYALPIASAVLLAANPWAWNTVAFDFHPHTIATLFVVLAARDLWVGRSRRPIAWASLAVLCGAPGALYVVGVGAAALMSRRADRRTALCVVGIGTVWFVFVSQIGGDGVGGAGLTYWYGYLARPHTAHATLATIARGTISHPSILLRMLHLRAHTVLIFLAAEGLVGVFSSWGFFMSAVVFLPTIFNSDPDYLSTTDSFQSWPAIPFVLIGTVSVLIWLIGHGNLTARTVRGIAAAWAATSVIVTTSVMSGFASYWLAVSNPASTQLARVEDLIPPNAEVIAENGTLGRFSDRLSVYQLGLRPPAVVAALWDQPVTVPVTSRIVVFLMTPEQGEGRLVAASHQTIALAHRLGATTLVARDGVYALEWHPAANVRTITLPA